MSLAELRTEHEAKVAIMTAQFDAALAEFQAASERRRKLYAEFAASLRVKKEA